MPAVYWHHMEYLDSDFAMSLWALQNTTVGKLNGVWNLFGMRSVNTILKKTVPKTWYQWKEKKVFERATKFI